MKPLPEKYRWLDNEVSPRVWLEARKHYGMLEHPGKGSNPNILAWAKEMGVSGWYTDDDIPWCGLFAGVCLKRAGYQVPVNFLSSLSFLGFGTRIKLPDAMFMDVLVFSRTGGGHVGFYIAEDRDSFLVYGGNQSDAVSFTWISKTRCVGVRRCSWKIGQPANVRKIILKRGGSLSKNES